MKLMHIFLSCQISFIPLILFLLFSFPNFQSWILSIRTHSIVQDSPSSPFPKLPGGAGDLKLRFPSSVRQSSELFLILVNWPAHHCPFLPGALPPSYCIPLRKSSQMMEFHYCPHLSGADRFKAMTL